jgi:hypothetical protein
VTLLRLAAESDISLRKLSLAERGLYSLSPDETLRRDEALRRLAESARLRELLEAGKRSVSQQ